MLEKLLTLNEKILADRKQEIRFIQDYMAAMKDDMKMLNETIQTMVDVLAQRVPNSMNRNMSQPPATFLNSECHYAGVYFVHN
jgi:hypothetical protein